MGTHRSTDAVRYYAGDILERRDRGESCRAIAEDLGVPEHQIWYLMRQTGYEGRVRARPVRRKRRRMTLQEVIKYIEEAADIIEIERSVDGEGWIVSIDDLPGDQCRTIDQAIRSALLRIDR